MIDLETQVLDKGITTGQFKLASGNYTDTKFDFDLISKGPDMMLFDQVAAGLGRLVGTVFPDCNAVLTVANGANPLAEPVAKAVSKILPHNIKTIRTKKEDEVLKLPSLQDLEDLKCVITDDVYSHGTNSGKVADLLAAAGVCVLGVAVVLNRSPNPQPQLKVGSKKLKVVSLFHYEIPDSSTAVDKTL